MENRTARPDLPRNTLSIVGIAAVVVVILAFGALVAMMFGLDVGTVFN
jgi:hypothetical protein